MASFCMERLLFVKKFTLYFRRLNFFLWSIVIVLLLQQVHCQKPPVYTAESCSNESVFLVFSTKSEQTAIQQSHIINPLLTSFARSVRESIAFGFYRTDLAPSSLGLYENLRQYFPVQTSHSVNKSLIIILSSFCMFWRYDHMTPLHYTSVTCIIAYYSSTVLFILTTSYTV